MTIYPPAAQTAESTSPLERPPIPDDWPAADRAVESLAETASEIPPEPGRWPGLRAQAGIGAAIGIGSAALVAALLYARKGNGGNQEPPAAKAGGRPGARTKAGN